MENKSKFLRLFVNDWLSSLPREFLLFQHPDTKIKGVSTSICSFLLPVSLPFTAVQEELFEYLVVFLNFLGKFLSASSISEITVQDDIQMPVSCESSWHALKLVLLLVSPSFLVCRGFFVSFLQVRNDAFLVRDTKVFWNLTLSAA